MIAEGRRKQRHIEFVEADIEKLPFGDDEFDAVTISFGLRNVNDPKLALAEMYRVLKPGGRLVICEFSKPPRAIMRAGYTAYLNYVMPVVSAATSSNREAYSYLADSIKNWPDQGQLSQWIRGAGFIRVAYRNLTSGVVALHRGRKPVDAAVLASVAKRKKSTRKTRRRKIQRRRAARRPPKRIDRHVTPSVPTARRSNTLSSSLGLGEKLFASSDERKLAKALDEGLEAVEAGLLEQMSFVDDLADVTSRYLLDAGGKRIRPVLTLLAAQLGGGNSANVYAGAEAIEMTHLASLYHDDVMDEAQMRRGVPSAQTVWGNSVAILTGDLLFARASKLVAPMGDRAILLQAETFERLCLGQLHETIGPRPGEDPIEHYLQVLADKTGSLIATAAQVGVMNSGAPEEYVEPVVQFGEKIGVAFQLVDDVIDLAPQPDETGKTPGTDLRAGVATLPLLYLRRLAETDAAAAELVERIDRDVNTEFAVSSLSGDENVDSAELTAAIAELREHPVTAQTLDEAHRWAADAVAALAPLPDGPVKTALTRFADTIVERSH